MVNHYDARKFNTDVLVCGGGVAGAAAAIVAARRGLKVLVLEYGISLGGLATNNYVTGIAGQVEGLSLEWINRCIEEGYGQWRPHLPLFDPDKAKILLETMIHEHGGRILYGTHVVDVNMEDDGKNIKNVIAYSKSGRMEISAKVYIDATGDGDVAAAAGAPYEEGSPEFMGLNMGTTLAFRFTNVNWAAYQKANGEWAKKQIEEKGKVDCYGLYNDMHRKALEAGDLPYFVFPSALMYPIPGFPEDSLDVSVMTCHSFYNHNTDVEDLTRQIVEQHQQILFLEKFFNKWIPGFEKAKVSGIGSLHGVRDSRRIIGEYVFKASDVACARKFEDGIVRFPEFFDTHHPTSPTQGFKRHIHMTEPEEPTVTIPDERFEGLEMHRFGTPAGVQCRPNPRDYCEIPFRSLVPLGVDNLLLAGRCVSAEFDSCGGVRVIAPSMGTGQAAALAAEIAVREGTRIRDIDPKLIRKKMIEEEGVELDKPVDGYWEERTHREGTLIVNFTDSADIITPKGVVPF